MGLPGEQEETEVIPAKRAPARRKEEQEIDVEPFPEPSEKPSQPDRGKEPVKEPEKVPAGV